MAGSSAAVGRGGPSGLPGRFGAARARFRRQHPLVLYAIRRLLAAAALVFFLSLIIFTATNVLPGDIPTTILGRQATPAQVQNLEEAMGLDKPLHERYTDWVTGVFQGDLGQSFTHDVPVSELLVPRMINTLLFALIAIAIMIPIGILLGVVAALRPGGVLDQVISSFGLIGISVPEFVWATVLALVFGVWLGVLPPTTITETPLEDPAVFVLPVMTMLVIGVPYTSRMVRASFLDVLRSDYVAMARLNGVSELRVIVRYALPNGLAPTIQILASTLQWLVGGVIVVETIFNYPGIGYMLVREVQLRDIPFVQSTALLIGTLFILINIVADLLIVFIVPKLRTSAR